MSTLSDYAQAPAGTAVVGLQAVVKKCYDKEPWGRGHYQNALIEDQQGGQMMAQFQDCPDLYDGMLVQASAVPDKKVNGVPTYDGCYVEDFRGKRRITIKKKCFTILSGGAPALAAAQYQPSAAYNPGQGGVPGYSPSAPALAPGGPLGPAYGQAQAAPLPGAYQPQAGQPGAFPGQPGRRPDPDWAAGAGLPSSPFLSVAQTQPAAVGWQPKPKMTVAEARQFLLDQFAELAEAMGREWAASAGQSAGVAVPLGQLPPEVVAGMMAWTTSLLIAYQRGDVVDEPVAGDDAAEQVKDLEAFDIAFGG